MLVVKMQTPISSPSAVRIVPSWVIRFLAARHWKNRTADFVGDFLVIAEHCVYTQEFNHAQVSGKNLGVYRDYSPPKGCTSAFAPIALSAMSKR